MILYIFIYNFREHDLEIFRDFKYFKIKNLAF